jgi:lauroyl/myristoyl acyltransferase
MNPKIPQVLNKINKPRKSIMLQQKSRLVSKATKSERKTKKKTSLIRPQPQFRQGLKEIKQGRI